MIKRLLKSVGHQYEQIQTVHHGTRHDKIHPSDGFQGRFSRQQKKCKRRATGLRWKELSEIFSEAAIFGVCAPLGSEKTRSEFHPSKGVYCLAARASYSLLTPQFGHAPYCMYPSSFLKGCFVWSMLQASYAFELLSLKAR